MWQTAVTKTRSCNVKEGCTAGSKNNIKRKVQISRHVQDFVVNHYNVSSLSSELIEDSDYDLFKTVPNRIHCLSSFCFPLLTLLITDLTSDPVVTICHFLPSIRLCLKVASLCYASSL